MLRLLCGHPFSSVGLPCPWSFSWVWCPGDAGSWCFCSQGHAGWTVLPENCPSGVASQARLAKVWSPLVGIAALWPVTWGGTVPIGLLRRGGFVPYGLGDGAQWPQTPLGYISYCWPWSWALWTRTILCLSLNSSSLDVHSQTTNGYCGQDFHAEKQNTIFFLWKSGWELVVLILFISLGQTMQNPPKLTMEQLPFQISFSSSNMVYLFLLVCFSLNPSITLQCKMVKLLACATFIMYLSLLITLAENAWTVFGSVVDWDRVNKYYLVFFFSLRSTAFLDCFLQLDWEYWFIHRCYNNCIQGTKNAEVTFHQLQQIN